MLDLRVQNKTLLTKFLFKFFNKQDIPWVNLICNNYYNNGEVPSYPTRVGSFWWRDCCSILREFKDMTISYAGNGNTIKLWSDKWCSQILSQAMPQLFSYVKNLEITLASASNMEEDEFYDLFHLLMSATAVQQSINLRMLINNRDN